MNDAALRELLDKEAIRETIVRAARALDAKDWALCRACLLDEIETDYSDLRGDPPATVKADDYVASRRSALDGLKTLHLSANHVISVRGDEAECLSSAAIFRFRPGEDGSSESFDTYGAYVHGLRRTANGWKIARIKQSVHWNSGSPFIHGALR